MADTEHLARLNEAINGCLLSPDLRPEDAAALRWAIDTLSRLTIDRALRLARLPDAPNDLREQMALRIGWKRHPTGEGWWDQLFVYHAAPPDYPASLAACEEVLDWLMANGWDVMMEYDIRLKKWQVWLVRYGKEHYGIAERLPEAICRAVVQIPGEDGP